MNKTFLFLVFICTIILLQSVWSQTTKCGGETRWESKVLIDSRANLIDFTPKSATIHTLSKWKLVVTGDTTPRFLNERKAVKVKALLAEYKREADKDYHLILIDPKHPEDSMVAEIPGPECPQAKQSGHAESYQEALDSLTAISGGKLNKTKKSFNPPVKCFVTGIPFYDPPHHGRKPEGNAPNNLEIHPIMKMGR